MTKWKAVKGTTPSMSVFRSNLLKGFRKVNTPAEKDFKLFVNTWDNKPNIKQHIYVEGDKISNLAGVESSWTKGKTAVPEDIFMFLTRGTSERYAVMENPFEAKTKVNSFNSGAGRGKKAYMTNNPVKGIDARKVEELAKQVHGKELKLAIEKLIIESALKSGIRPVRFGLF